MPRTREIVRGQHDKEYLVSPEQILNWYPADFIRQCHKCDPDVLYHTCISTKLQWEYVMDINRNDDRYYDIFKSVKKLGLVAPVRAKVTQDDHVVVLDGHNRVGVALDMSLREVPVWIGARQTDPDDLKAPDSGLWQKHNKPWIAQIGK